MNFIAIHCVDSLFFQLFAMDERIPTRDRLFHNYPMMDSSPPEKKRRVEMGTSGIPINMMGKYKKDKCFFFIPC